VERESDDRRDYLYAAGRLYGDPTPIQYTVQDNDGNTSNPATVTVDYNQQPPVANNDSSLANPPGR